MRRRSEGRDSVFLGVCFLLVCCGAAQAEEFTIAVDATRPAVRDRHTSLLADFDGTADNHASYARGMRLAGGFENQPQAPGKFGDGVGLPGWLSQLHFRGEGNVNPTRGTVQFWVKSGPKLNFWRSNR